MKQLKRTSAHKVFPVPNPKGDVKWIPSMKRIPEKFKDCSSDIKPIVFFSRSFFSGLKELSLLPREGVDASQAWQALLVVQGSWALKHQHKQAAFAYLVDQWFSDFRYQDNGGQEVPFDDATLEADFQKSRGEQ